MGRRPRGVRGLATILGSEADPMTFSTVIFVETHANILLTDFADVAATRKNVHYVWLLIRLMAGAFTLVYAHYSTLCI